MKNQDNKMMTPMQNMNMKMNSMHMTGNPDHDFAEMMIVHHQGAIDMAQAELNSGKDPFLKSFAEKVIKDQTKEIEELQQWLQEHK